MSSELQTRDLAPSSNSSDVKEAKETASSPTAERWTDKKALNWLQKISDDFDSLSAETGTHRRSALHVVASDGPADLLNFLLSRFERLERRDKTGKNPLHLAVEADRSDNVKAIISYCLEDEDTSVAEEILDARDEAMQTPIMIACSRGHAASLRCFFASYPQDRKPKVDLWLKDKDGRTALHHAARLGHTKCVDILLDNANDPRVYIHEKDAHGLTSLQLARTHRATFKLLDEKNVTLQKEMDSTFWLTVAAFSFIALGLISGLVSAVFFIE